MLQAGVLAAVIAKNLTVAAQEIAGKVQLFYSPLSVSKAHSRISGFSLLLGVAVCFVSA